jgi:hypothetical protein
VREPSGATAPEGKADALLPPKHDRVRPSEPAGTILPFLPPEHQDYLLATQASFFPVTGDGKVEI